MVGSGRGTGMGAAALLPLAGWSMAGLGTERSTLRITASRSGEGMPAAFSAGAAGGLGAAGLFAFIAGTTAALGAAETAGSLWALGAAGTPSA